MISASVSPVCAVVRTDFSGEIHGKSLQNSYGSEAWLVGFDGIIFDGQDFRCLAAMWLDRPELRGRIRVSCASGEVSVRKGLSPCKLWARSTRMVPNLSVQLKAHIIIYIYYSTA